MSQFNLLDEKWLMVMTCEKGETEEVSLKEIFSKAHMYKQLAGETPTQDFAILRLLLAILHTVFSRFDADGESYEWVDINEDTLQVKGEIDEDDIEDYKEDLFITWQNLWKKKEFPDIINKYLERYRHRFFLIDEKYPFFQFPEISEPDYPYSATDNSINKLNGRILEGDPRKPRLFMSQHQSTLDYSASARWLLYINGYAPSKSGNPGKKQKRASTGVAYLGKLGGIYASGKNLFETLLLNLNLGTEARIQRPIWELEPKIYNFKAIPDNLAQLFTYPSRQLLLKTNEQNQVIEYRLDLAVSNFEYVPNLKIEPFTFWRYDIKLDEKKWNTKEGLIPKRHDPEKYFWQEMQSFASIEEKYYRPGIIEWLRMIQGEELVTGLIYLNAVGENYIQKDGVIDRQIFDQISENIGLLDAKDDGWLFHIADEIKNTERVIEKTIICFASDIDKIRNSDNNPMKEKTKTQIFFSVDLHFRKWLINILPQDDKNNRSREWRNILHEEISFQADEIIKEAGSRDYLGYEGKKGVENIQTAYNRFRRNLKKELEVK